MWVDAKTCAARLLAAEDVLILCHRDPDGDTYGCAEAIAAVLEGLGKRARIECPSEFPASLSFLHRDHPDFTPRFILAVDIAAVNMLGDGDRRAVHINLCIDHHPTNPGFADETFLVDYAASGEAVYEVFREMGVQITPYVATALFTALSSDTGGFRFANTTAQTHRYAADLIELGADADLVRRQLFESNSRGRVRVESDALANARYYHGGAIAVISVSVASVTENDVDESELEGLAAEPLKVEGVHIGVTLKEREDGSVRVSVRSDSDEVSAARICSQFHGGGHVRAAGCRVWTTLAEAEPILVAACERELKR